MNLEEHGARYNFAHGDDGGVETLEMADLQNCFIALSDRDQRVGFLQRSSDWLFDEHVNSRGEQTATDASMFGSGDGKAYGLDAVGGERVEIAKNARAKFRGDFLGALG